MRRAEIRTTHDSPERVANALRPDNTDEMTTRVEDDAVVTTVERDTTGGLQATVDDYVVNLRVAAQLANNDTRSNHE
ncbi:KEOPS complex subunit Pcc1 [Haloarcula salina]|uniref:KEOPS complex Pcc1-like subunit n=1 Tax=Haloarcula salina TaxID=1429914 RepID=A0AA41G019_9EURY|nr:KEOPS complex subunit Pcc1 [Haloarcula salina]MBV0901798.1 KEOPS complex Pcc1-like subunit [Haloarcula salina]